MFFILSKTIGLLVLPLVPIIGSLVLSAILRKRRARLSGVLFWAAVIALYALSIRPVADALLLPLESPYETRMVPGIVDAIVVLGGALDLSRSEPGRIEMGPAGDRFVEAVLLAKQYPDALLIFSGGTASLTDQSKLEAPLLRDYAIKLGVPANRIRIDVRSRNTHENAAETAKILAAEGARFVVLITSAFHMKRSLGCFYAQGIVPAPYAVDFRGHWSKESLLNLVPRAWVLADSMHALREYAGLLVYRAKGYI